MGGCFSLFFVGPVLIVAAQMLLVESTKKVGPPIASPCFHPLFIGGNSMKENTLFHGFSTVLSRKPQENPTKTLQKPRKNSLENPKKNKKNTDPFSLPPLFREDPETPKTPKRVSMAVDEEGAVKSPREALAGGLLECWGQKSGEETYVFWRLLVKKVHYTGLYYKFTYEYDIVSFVDTKCTRLY